MMFRAEIAVKIFPTRVVGQFETLAARDGGSLGLERPDHSTPVFPKSSHHAPLLPLPQHLHQFVGNSLPQVPVVAVQALLCNDIGRQPQPLKSRPAMLPARPWRALAGHAQGDGFERQSLHGFAGLPPS